MTPSVTKPTKNFDFILSPQNWEDVHRNAEKAHAAALADLKKRAGPFWLRNHKLYFEYCALKRLGPDYGLYEQKCKNELFGAWADDIIKRARARLAGLDESE